MREAGNMKKWLILLTALLVLPVQALACTLYAANGDIVEGGGSIIGKNRDFIPGRQQLKIGHGSKYDYYGLFSFSKKGNALLRAGVNEKGLVVINSSTDSIDKNRLHSVKHHAPLKEILSSCSTVAEALLHREFFAGPSFVMLADKDEIAYIEHGFGQKVSVVRKQNDSLVHTNHYLIPRFEGLNNKIGKSSKQRYIRATELMESFPRPITFDAIKELSQDRNDGPDLSIWRTGSRPDGTRSQASFIVDIHPDGDFNVWVKYAERPEDKGNEKIIELSRSEIFGK